MNTSAPSPNSKNRNQINSDQTSNQEKLVLVGNPNVGKSVVFNHLSGLYADVSNFPGTTVSITSGTYKNYELLDTPGVYGVSGFNDEEKVARDMILEADRVLNIVNALQLDRDLFLTLQLIEMGKKVTVVLNFMDEVEKRGIKIDTQKLSKMLGVEVIETSAISKSGFDKLDFAVESARAGSRDLELTNLIEKIRKDAVSDAELILILEGDQDTAKKCDMEPGDGITREKLYIDRRNRASEIVSFVKFNDDRKGYLFNKIGRWSLTPLTGLPILAAVLFVMYLFVGDLISQRIVNFTENKIGVEFFEYNVKKIVGGFTSVTIDVDIFDQNAAIVESKSFMFPDGTSSDEALSNEFNSFAKREGSQLTFHFQQTFVKLFFGEFGIFTMTITYLAFLLFPLVLGFYFVMAFLEDSGYLPRLATMLDRSLNTIGLNGKAVIPIMLGFGCITMANITTRILGTHRERTIVTTILQFVIPCSAQLAVITVLLSGKGIMPLLIYGITISTVLIILSTILNKLLKGESSPLLLDLPAMKIPQMKNVFQKTIFRSWGFMKEAGVWFFVGAAGIGILDVTGWLVSIQNFLAPLTTNWLLLPKEAATAFVMGLVRRDFGAAGLFELNMSTMQITVAIITITLFVPCIASFVVMLKERGIKEGLTVWIGTWITAFLIGGIVARIII